MPLIVVVGAGIAGLATALAVAGSADVVVLERRSAHEANAGAGIQLSPNAVKALRAIGVADRVAACAVAPTALVVRSGRRVVTRLSYRGLMQERFGAPYLTASRAALHEALADAVADRGVAVRYACAVERVEPGEGGILVPAVGRADLVVAADGVQSPLRARIVGDAPQATGWTAWRGSGDAVAGDETDLVLGAGHHLVRYPLSDASENCVLIARDRHGPDTIARTDTGHFMGDVADWKPWSIRVRPAEFHAGRIAFAGDAAHAMLPFLAQGGAAALEDAAVLGIAVGRHGAGEAAVDAYATARRRRVVRIAALAEAQGRIYHLPFPLAQARDLALARFGPEGIARRMAFIWSWSPDEAG